MSAIDYLSAETGLEVVDLYSDPEFASRKLHPRDMALQLEGMERLAHAFVENPETMLQELVQAAIDLCGADSSGISVVKDDATDQSYYRWVAAAGGYAGFLHAELPRYPSACGVCLERGRPQLFRVRQEFFDLLTVEAQVATDGILIPWQVDEIHGTIWIVAHGRREAFDVDDCRIMQTLANFAAMGVRQQRQQKQLTEQASAAAVANMANHLAHKINNPLQSLTNLVFLTEVEQTEGGKAQHTPAIRASLDRLNTLVRELLALPFTKKQG
jgi:signal transduction histidine kinase